MKFKLLIIFGLIGFQLVAQKTIVSGIITESGTGEPIPFVNVFFEDTKSGAVTDFEGKYYIETYYASTILVVQAIGYETKRIKVKMDVEQTVNIELDIVSQTEEEVVIYAPKDKPSTILYRKIVKNKNINNKKKLDAYEYEMYNKIQLDLNNIGDRFEDNGIVKSLKEISDYIDTAEAGRYLPLILSETLSHFYFRKSPTKQKEVIHASQITGVDNLELNVFLGEMYQDINVYEDYIKFFDKSFISPISNIALSFYTFYLADSAYIDNQWCYLMTFTPKRTGELTFEGEMWIHDTTYAVKQWKASINKGVDINYVKSFEIEQVFEQVEPEVWMMTLDRLFLDLKITKTSKALGIYGRKVTSRKNFVINQPHPSEFYRAQDNVVRDEGYRDRDEEYWIKHRHFPLSIQEEKVFEMVDLLQKNKWFNFYKNATFLATSGYYPVGWFEFGDIKRVIGYNKVEGFRNELAIRTSNDFSRRFQIWTRLAYGYRDKQFKYGAGFRFNITPKKRGMLDVFYDYDVVQLGTGNDGEEFDGTFGSLLRAKPFTQLTGIERFGFQLEKDVGKSWIITPGAVWKSVTALGTTQFREPIGLVGYNTLENIKTFEASLKIRWSHREEFISGAFDRVSVGSRFPIISLTGTFGISGVLGSQYDYQKVELKIESAPRIGILGTLNYEIFGGIIFGQAPYPFLKIHEGSQSYWLQSWNFNKMDYYEFISDRYVGLKFEHHFNGLILGHIPLVKKLKWRLVYSGRAVWGDLSDKQREVMMVPENTVRFGKIPYVETGVGIENIFKIFRVDVIWRVTHRQEGVSPIGVRAKMVIRL